MKNIAILLKHLSKKDKNLFLKMCSFLIAKFPDQFHLLYLTISSASNHPLKHDNFECVLMKRIMQEDGGFFEEVESFFLQNQRTCADVFDGWVYEINNVKDNPLLLLEKINRNENLMSVDLLSSIYTQISAQMFFKGLLQNENENLNKVYSNLIQRLDPILPNNNDCLSSPTKPKIYVFVGQVIWGSKHAPTLILKQWIELLFPIFGKVQIIVSTPLDYYLPLQERFYLRNIYPSDQSIDFDIENIEPTISNSEIQNTILGKIGEKDICLSIGTSSILFDRIHVKNKFLWPTVQYPFLHSARFVFSVNGDKLKKENIFNEKIQFFNVSTQGFIPLDDAYEACMPSARFERIKNEDLVRLVVIGNNIAFEMDAEFFSIIKLIATKFQVDLTCIGIKEFSFPIIENVSFQCVGFQDDLQNFVADAEFDFFINPKRNGGGFGAVVCLIAGIPVLTLPHGDVFSVMEKYYFMNEKEDFLEFITRFKTEKEFRTVIDSLHLAMKNNSQSDRVDPLSKMIEIIEDQK